MVSIQTLKDLVQCILFKIICQNPFITPVKLEEMFYTTIGIDASETHFSAMGIGELHQVVLEIPGCVS
ncbi:hypothetical protein ABEB36_010807 [Hypothenemus hampei]|uniref:Uncharacterized protein n=1 Tax=Hypothenemus hampei TaxID=57062 RepID=A0ABD1ED29_HYPHA